MDGSGQVLSQCPGIPVAEHLTLDDLSLQLQLQLQLTITTTTTFSLCLTELIFQSY